MIDESKILGACTFARERGWLIREGVWIDERERCCCPMGAVWIEARAVERMAGLTPPTPEALSAELLGVTADEVIAFNEGFDGHGAVPFAPLARAAYDAGRSVRNQIHEGEDVRASEVRRVDGSPLARQRAG